MGEYAWTEVVSILQPAAGANIQRKIPGETFEGLLSAHVTLTTSATVANRTPVLRMQNPDGVVVAQQALNVAIAASSVVDLTWAVGLDSIALGVTGPVQGPLAALLLQPGWLFVITALGIQANDQFSAANLYMRRVPSGPMAASFGANPYDYGILG